MSISLETAVSRVEDFYSEHGYPMSIMDYAGSFLIRVQKKVAGEWVGRISSATKRKMINEHCDGEPVGEPQYGDAFHVPAIRFLIPGLLPSKDDKNLTNEVRWVVEHALGSMGAHASVSVWAPVVLRGESRGKEFVLKNKNTTDCVHMGTQLVTHPSRTNALDNVPTLTIDKIDDTTGTLTLSDVVEQNELFMRSQSDVAGVLKWIPLTDTEANMEFGCVDRSKNPRRLAGGRVFADPTDILGTVREMIRDATMAMGNREISVLPDHVLYAGASTCTRIIQAASADKDSSVDLAPSKRHYILRTGGCSVELVADPYLRDDLLTADEDLTMALLDMKTWEIRVTKKSPFQNLSGGSDTRYVCHIPGGGDYIELGWTGNLFCTDPSKNVVASSRARD